MTLRGENLALRREGLESPWKSPSRTRTVRTCAGRQRQERMMQRMRQKENPRNCQMGYGRVGEGRGALGGTWPPPGRKFRPGAAVGWGPGWGVERTQKTVEFGNIQDECQSAVMGGLVCQAGNVGLAKERGWRR